MKLVKRTSLITEAKEEAKVVTDKGELELDSEKVTPVADQDFAGAEKSIEANKEAAKENIEAANTGKTAEELVKETHDLATKNKGPKIPKLKPYTEAKDVADRKELAKLISECKQAGRQFKISRSLKEGFRYMFEEFEEDIPECMFICHSDDDANNENGYFDDLDSAIAYAEEHPEICCIFKVCGDEEENVWQRPTNESCKIEEDVCPKCGKKPCECSGECESGECLQENIEYIECKPGEGCVAKLKDEYGDKLIVIHGPEDIENLGEVESDKVILVDEADRLPAGKGLIARLRKLPNKVLLAVQDKRRFESLEEDISPSVNVDMLQDIFDWVCDHEDLIEDVKAYLRHRNWSEDDIMALFDDIHDEVIDEALKEDIGEENPEEHKEEDKTEVHTELPDFNVEVEQKGDKVEVEIEPKVATDSEEIIPEENKEEIVVSESLKEDLNDEENVDLNDENVENKDIPEVAPEAEQEVVPEDAEVDIDEIENYEPVGDPAPQTFTSIKDAGEGAMFAFKDTLRDLYGLTIKVSDLQKLLSDSSDWLLNLLGIGKTEEVEVAPEELPAEPVEAPVEVPEENFEDPEPVVDGVMNMDGFDDPEPIEVSQEDIKDFID